MSTLVDLTEKETDILAGILVSLYRKKPAYQPDCRVIARKLNIGPKFDACLVRQTRLKFEEETFDPEKVKQRTTREDVL